MPHSVSELLPYSDDILLDSIEKKIRVLRVLKFLFKEIRGAIQAVKSRSYDAFDAQVSENLCQVRAYQFVRLFNDAFVFSNKDLDSFFDVVIDADLKCETLLARYHSYRSKRPSDYVNDMKLHIILSQFLRSHEFEFCIPHYIFTLSQAFILSRYKLFDEYGIPCGMDYEKLCTSLKIDSKTFASKIVHVLQRSLSQNSCQFIFKIFDKLSYSKEYSYLLQSLYYKDEVGRHVLPCYEVTRMILEDAIKKREFIKVKVVRIFRSKQDIVTFFLKPSWVGGHYHLSKVKKFYSKKAVMTFSGFVHYEQHNFESAEDYISRFISFGFENILLSNMAQHPQYSGLKLDERKNNPYQVLHKEFSSQDMRNYIMDVQEKFLYYKALSAAIGCTPDNPSLFLLAHISCDDMINNVDEIALEESLGSKMAFVEGCAA